MRERRLLKRTISAIMLTLLIGVSMSTLNVQPVNASGTIYIKADGSVDPSWAPITRNGNLYIFTSNINDSIVVQRSNIIVNGDGYTLQGPGSFPNNGFYLYGVNNVTIKNTIITNFIRGVQLTSPSDNNIISGNTITNNSWYGIQLLSSSNNIISGNNITNNYWSVTLQDSYNNTISGNNISQPAITVKQVHSIALFTSSNNIISGNNITNNYWYGILLDSSSNNNTISENNITNNPIGIRLQSCSNNIFYHNNFLDNTQQVYIATTGYANLWDDGYPYGGNYWSNYNGTDVFRGVYQNENGSDGIGDTALVLDVSNKDNYPLKGPFGALTRTGSNVAVFPTSDVGLIFGSVTSAGSSTVNKTATGPAPPSGRTLVGQYYDIKTTANYTGKITIRIIYDDTNMTQARENSLQLSQWNATAARVVGDITGPNGWPDGKVDIRDLAKVAKLYGVIYPDPRYDPICDLTGPTPGVSDGKIDIRDLAYIAKNYGKIIQEWINITTYIDTQNNVIYGETSHLSIFGIT